jgi:hypothetical protein
MPGVELNIQADRGRPSYEIRHPEMAWLTRTDILVGIDVADDGVPAEFKICSLLHVTAIEPLNVPSSN